MGGTSRVGCAVLCAAATLVACSGPATAPGPTAIPTPLATPADAAMAAYQRYWSVTDAAFASPGSRDWTPQLRDVAEGTALAGVLKDVANYASFPAHQVGSATRTPRVDGATDARVGIVDCVDLGDSRLVSDKTGAVLDDLANRVERYRFTAEIIMSGGRWLVSSTTPSLDEPC